MTAADRRMAKDVAASLFVDGAGVPARRLVMERYQGQFNEAGWCERAIADRIATALAAAERRGEDRVLRWIARFGGNYIPGGGFTSMIEAYRKARRRARGSRS